jgi:hypothetical protein
MLHLPDKTEDSKSYKQKNCELPQANRPVHLRHYLRQPGPPSPGGINERRTLPIPITRNREINAYQDQEVPLKGRSTEPDFEVDWPRATFGFAFDFPRQHFSCAGISDRVMIVLQR